MYLCNIYCNYEMKRTHINIVLKIIIAIISMVMIEACSYDSSYPKELTLADSAFIKGNYNLGDALLELCPKLINRSDKQQVHYMNLLRLEQAYMHGLLSENQIPLIDSLYSFYANYDDEKTAKTVLFIGEIYKKNGDYPSALDNYLKAKELAERSNSYVLCLVMKNLGDLYYVQRMFPQCIPYYEEYYRLSKTNNDTLRMAYGAFNMGRVYSIINNVDSAIFYYNQSMKLGKGHPQEGRIVPYAQNNLCDLYIQTEQFDKALEIMPRNDMNDANWAYWHYGQEHVDSAIYYFQKILGRFKWQGETEVLSHLAHLEEKRGDLNAALAYFKQLEVAMDSLRVQQKTEETLRTEARYNYDQIQQERDKLEKRNTEMKHLIWLLLVVILATVVVSLLIWRSYQQKRKASLARQQLLEHEKEEQQRQSQQKLEENRQKLAMLEQELAAARQQDDAPASERLRMEAEVLTSQNQNIEARQRRKEALLRELMNTALYQRLKAPAKEGAKKMTEAEWQQLATSLDEIYDQFSRRLLQLAKLSETELRICYLLKIKMPPAEIADILCKSKAAITLARRRMYEKLTATRGKAEQLDELILEL